MVPVVTGAVVPLAPRLLDVKGALADCRLAICESRLAMFASAA